MNKTLTISVVVILGILLLVVFMPVFTGIKQKVASVIGIGAGNRYCDASKTTLTEFSKNLQSKLHDNDKALRYYEYSSECFGPEDIIMDKDIKKRFFCEDNPNLRNTDDDVKKYCS